MVLIMAGISAIGPKELTRTQFSIHSTLFLNLDVEQQLQRIKECGDSLQIFTVGKVGGGKSSLTSCLVGDFAVEKQFTTAPEWRPGTTKVEKYEIQIKNSKNTFVYVYDTQGLFGDSSQPAIMDETAELIEKMCSNDVNGVLIVCLPMYERFDKSTKDTLTMLHRKFGDQNIWKHAVIVLTKADLFPDEWLESKKWWQRSAPILKRKFEETHSDCRKFLKEMFTKTIDGINPPWMTEEEFDDIPILPTSKLTEAALSKMEDVGHQFWFENLLIKCCEREQGTVLINIHSKRLAALSKEAYRQVKETLGKAEAALQVPITADHIVKTFKATGAEFIYNTNIIDILKLKVYRWFNYSAVKAKRFQYYPAEESS